MTKHFAAAIVLILAGSAVAGADCFSRFCTSKVQHVAVQKVIVQKQIVAQPVYFSGYYHQPVGYQTQGHKSQDELTAAALDRLNATLRESNGLTVRVQSSGGLQKCAKCHTGNGPGVGDFEIPDGPMGWRTAQRVQFALEETDMSTRAKLSEDEYRELKLEASHVIYAALNRLNDQPADADVRDLSLPPTE